MSALRRLWRAVVARVAVPRLPQARPGGRRNGPVTEPAVIRASEAQTEWRLRVGAAKRRQERAESEVRAVIGGLLGEAMFGPRGDGR